MKTFADYLAEITIVSTPQEIQKDLEDIIAKISNMESAQIEDSKPQLLELKELLNKRLAGAI